MKKRFPLLIAGAVLLLLIARLLYRHANGVKDERAWYIAQLHYDFSARVDSVIRPGRVLIHLTHGNADTNREWKLKDDLQFNGILHLMIPNGRQFDVRAPTECQPLDSLYVNSFEDQLYVYRDQKLIVSRPLSASLRGRPF